MSGTKSGPWITGTVVVALLVLVAAWFLGISPQLTAAAESNEQAQAQHDANRVLETRITTLAEQFTHIEEYRNQLAASRVQIPATLDLAAYQRELNQIASAHSVVIVNLTVTASQAVTPPVAEAAPAEEDEDTATTDEETESTETAAEAAPAGLSGFYHLPVAIEVLGTYQDVMAFLHDAQTGTQRLFLVTGLTGTGQQESEAGGGRPATRPGDLGLIVAGSLFVLQDESGTAPVVDLLAPLSPLPVPGGDKNPLVPIG